MKTKQIKLSGNFQQLETDRFRMVAYTGDIMRNFIDGEIVDVIVDLAGLDITKRGHPIIFCHDQAQIVGLAQSIEVIDGQLIVEGEIYSDLSMPKVIKKMQAGGISWQASIGIDIHEVQYVGDFVTPANPNALTMAYINGRQVFDCHVIRRSTLQEISFCLQGADSQTEALVFRSIKDTTIMDNKKKLAASAPAIESDQVKPDETEKQADTVTPAASDDAAKTGESLQAAKVDETDDAQAPGTAQDDETPPAGKDGKAGEVKSAAFSAGYDLARRELQIKADETATEHERQRCLALTMQFRDYPELLQKHVKAGSDVTKAKADLADVLLAQKAEDGSAFKAGSGVKSAKFLAGSDNASVDDTSDSTLEASWQNNVDDCRKTFAKKEHFYAFKKRNQKN